MEIADEQLLVSVGVRPDVAAELAAALADGGDDALGVVGGDEPEVRGLLRAALLAARSPRWIAEGLVPLLATLGARDAEFLPFERGVLGHLAGLAAWRHARDVPEATRMFNRSLRLLDRVESPSAARYVGRVLDTLGQMLQHVGLLTDARYEFERALTVKEAGADASGAALTRGNLGRLCMELGDFRAAAEHLEADLEFVVATAPGDMRLRGQLRTQIGVCRMELDEGDAARAHLESSLESARAGSDVIGMAFAGVHLGRLALRERDPESAATRAAQAEALLPDLPGDLGHELTGLVGQLLAEVAAQRGDLGTALELFGEAGRAFDAARRVSPVEHAEFLRTWAEACAARGDGTEASALLRRALRRLDATSAETMRVELDARLREIDEGAWMLHSTGRFVGHGQIEVLLDQAAQSGFRGHEEEVTVLFSDLRSFTAITEGLPPEVLIDVLNRYLAHMTRCVEHFGGLVDKFIGDAVMAVFSLPSPRPDDADRAAASALYMHAELERFNRSLPASLTSLAAGVGLHVGKVVAGLIGSPQKRSYTVIGDVVNTASRLEGMTKQLGVPVLITEEVRAALTDPDRWLVVPYGSFRPKGRKAAVAVHHLVGVRDGGAATRETEARAAAAREALAALTSRDFAAARVRFEALRDAAAAEDGTGARGWQMLAAASAAFESAPPDADWNGSIELVEK